MTEPLLQAAFGVGLTLAVFAVAQRIYARTGWMLLNPVLISVAVIIGVLSLTEVELETYQRGGSLLSALLGPAVVALGLPLSRQLDMLLSKARAVGTSILVGSVVGIGSGVLTARALGASREVVLSLAPRSVTTPIALGITERLGGIPPLVAALVIGTGVVGAVVGPWLLTRIGVRSRTAVGLALGASAHGIGTARAVEEGEVEGATAGLAIGLMGIATALLAPVVWALLVWLGMV